jgi:5-methylcytosine-specific restriction endonuclease McrA
VKGEYDADEARWLLEAQRLRVHEQVGYGTLLEYLERLFGYGPRMAKERLRVAEALAKLPAIREALASGALAWSAVREISRVAAPTTEDEWLAAARGKTVREVEEMVSGRKPGDRPSDPAEPVTRHVLRLEISSDALAAFREARRRIELDVGHSLDDDAAVRMLAHYALGGPDEPGRAPYQIAMTVCKECGRGTRDGSGQVLEVEPHRIEAARCDGQEIDLTHVGSHAAAAQNIPPRVRRLVWRRDHGRCQVPGCRAAKHLEVHHLRWRSDGGGHDPSNLTAMCDAHHDLVHRGLLVVEGSAPDLVFRHADGTLYGQRGAEEADVVAGLRWMGVPSADARRAEAAASAAGAEEADVVAGLRRMGVPAADARRAVAEAAASGAVRLEELLRRALLVLRRTTYASLARTSERGEGKFARGGGSPAGAVPG